eukprot:XP_019929873.1 PREDICTED: uncharacterized protein LOC105345786 isoform X2 [Crassostrea gigas]
MKKENVKKQRLLEKNFQKSKAQAHVKKILQEQKMLWQREREHGDSKNHKGKLVVTADLYDQANNCVPETNPNEEKSVQDSKCPAIHTYEKSLSPETDLFLSDSEKSDFVTNIKKSSENEEASSLVDKPCRNSEPSSSLGTFPSPSGCNGKKTLSLKARRRKTLSPNTFSRNKSQNISKEKSSESELAKSILIADDDEKESVKCVNDEAMENTVENFPRKTCKTSIDSENTDSFKLLDSQSSLDLFPPSIEACEKIKTKRKRGRGRPSKCRRASLPAPVKKPSVNSLESQESQELETLILLQESLGMGSPIERRKTRNSRSCQPIVLSSLFQYIIDEAKREQGQKEFALPGYTFGKLMESKSLLEIKNEAMEAEDAEDKCETLKEENEFSQTERISMSTEVDNHSTYTAFESECQNNGMQKQEKFIEAFEQQEPKTEEVENVPDTISSPVAQCNAISNFPSLTSMHLKTGDFSDVSDSESKDIEESYATKEAMDNKVEELTVDEKHNTNRETNSSDVLMSFDEPVSVTVCQDSQQPPEQMKVSQQSEEDSQGEQDLNSSIGSDQQTESDDDNFGDILRERMATKFPIDDPVIQSHITVVPLNKKKTEVVVCLCQRSLSVWAVQSKEFNSLQKWSFPQGQTAIRGVLMLPKSSEVRFAAILEGSGELGLYSAVFQEDQAFPLFKISDIQAPTHQFHVCAVAFNEVVISQCNSNLIQLLKYTMDYEVKTLSKTTSLEEAAGVLDTVCCIQGQQQAVAGYTREGMLHIWNHELGALIVSINLAVYWPHTSHLVTVFHEKGYLFCPLMARSDCFLAGCMMLVNPTNCQTQVLFPFNSRKWKGCRRAFHLDEYIAAVNNSGSLHIWDKFNGDMVSCMEKAGVLGMSSHRNNIVISRAHCIHCFTVQ